MSHGGRRSSDPLTDEDRAAWFDWQVRPGRDGRLWGALELQSGALDARDAETLYLLQYTRRHLLRLGCTMLDYRRVLREDVARIAAVMEMERWN